MMTLPTLVNSGVILADNPTVANAEKASNVKSINGNASSVIESTNNPLIVIKNQQIRNSLDMTGIQFCYDTAFEHSFQFLNQFVLKFAFQHK